MSDITSADAVYGPGAGHLHETDLGGNPYPYGECTWYCWQYYHDTQSVDINGQLGNATDWVTNAHREQWVVDQTPAVAKTVSWSAAKYPPFGHVAVIVALNGDGTFDVMEMNFTYFADSNAQLAGKIDRRTVKATDGIQGYITPQGVKVGETNTQNSLLDALGAPMRAIGGAIQQAGLYLEAQAMTAELRAVSMAQAGLGTVIAGGGLTLGALTVYGRGRPGAGAARVQRQATGGRRRVEQTLAPEKPAPVRTPDGWAVRGADGAQRLFDTRQEAARYARGLPASGERGYFQAEQRWLSPRQTRELRQRTQPPRQPPKPEQLKLSPVPRNPPPDWARRRIDERIRVNRARAARGLKRI